MKPIEGNTSEVLNLLFLSQAGDENYLEGRQLLEQETHVHIHHKSKLADAADLLSDTGVDVVVTSLKLDDVEGTEIINKMLAFNPRLPIIVLEARKDEAVSLASIKAGAQDYLAYSTLDSKVLLRSINYALERKRQEQSMGYLTHYDNLTGLLNRVSFKNRLDRALARAKRTSSEVAILFIDLDRFKQINDTLGHEVGDAILVEVSERLKLCTRQEDTVARLGGDKFMIILEHMNSASDAAIVSNKIIEILAEPCMAEGYELYITPSIGITVYPNDHENASELLKNADAAVYRAKDKGRNRFQFYAEGMNRESVQRLSLEAKLRRALDNNEFVLHFQPKFDIKTQSMIGAEALIRWQHPEQGMVPPFEFIPLAEETGLIVPIGEWVIQEACQHMYRWKQDGFAPIRMSVNLSPRQFYQTEIVDKIINNLTEYEINPNEFEVEITESLLMEDTDSTINILNSLKAWGIHISVDDFGTGYCSLGYLKKFPIDTLKIDRAFIKDITSEPDDAAIAQAIIALGHTLHLQITAEGIETEGQLRFLKQYNCDEGQGFLYSKPLSTEDMTLFMEKMKHTMPHGNGSVISLHKSA